MSAKITAASPSATSSAAVAQMTVPATPPIRIRISSVSVELLSVTFTPSMTRMTLPTFRVLGGMVMLAPLSTVSAVAFS